MYSTCIFCNRPLGSNEALEVFPVGKRLAFDGARGRLWVVCPSCERWNLSPLDERWEAIEQAEKLYRDTRRRVSTDNIGLAKIREGTTLVRIGEPQRPEFAAWRYGDQFGRRRRRHMLIAAGGITAVGGLVIGGAVAGVSIGGFVGGVSQIGRALVHGRGETIVAKIATEERGVIHVRRRHLGESTIARDPNGELILNLRFKNGQATFTGREAERIASIVIPKVNRAGGNKTNVADAVKEIESFGDSSRFVQHIAGVAHVYTKVKVPKRGFFGAGNYRFEKWGLFSLPHTHRLALEMALHEDAERRALEGELAELERAWRDAEEIAGIADNLTVPESVETALRKLKDK